MNGTQQHTMETTLIVDHSYSTPRNNLENEIFHNNDVSYREDHEDARSDRKRKCSAIETSSDESYSSKKNFHTEHAEHTLINDCDSGDDITYAVVKNTYLNTKEENSAWVGIQENNVVEQDLLDNISRTEQLTSVSQKEKFGIKRLEDDVLNEQDIRQIENIHHAFHCNKLQNKSCPEAFCTNPQSIINVVKHNLSQVYERKVKGNIRRECIAQTYKLVIFHARNCNNRSDCQMPLCKEYQDSLEKLLETEEHSTEYDVLNITNEKLSKKTIHDGEDFEILYEANIDKGMFGKISWCVIRNKDGKVFSTVLKRIPLEHQPISRALSVSLPALAKFRNHRHILVPDFAVHNKREVCLFMPRADLSLFQYMKTYEGGMPPEAVTYYIYQLAKALKKIHGCDYTHGDVKVSNCLLFKDGEVLKLSDLDSLKPINVRSMSGSQHFADPRILDSGNVDKPSDIYSLCQCIAVLLFGTNKIIKDYSPDQIYQLIRKRDVDLAEIYRFGTTSDMENRITADQLVAWFRKNVSLKARCSSFEPKPMPTSIMPGKDLCDHIVEGYFTSMMKDLPAKFNLVL